MQYVPGLAGKRTDGWELLNSINWTITSPPEEARIPLPKEDPAYKEGLTNSRPLTSEEMDAIIVPPTTKPGGEWHFSFFIPDRTQMEPGATVRAFLERVHKKAVNMQTSTEGFILGSELFFTGFEDMRDMCGEKVSKVPEAKEFFSGVYYLSLDDLDVPPDDEMLTAQ